SSQAQRGTGEEDGLSCIEDQERCQHPLPDLLSRARSLGASTPILRLRWRSRDRCDTESCSGLQARHPEPTEVAGIMARRRDSDRPLAHDKPIVDYVHSYGDVGALEMRRIRRQVRQTASIIAQNGPIYEEPGPNWAASW